MNISLVLELLNDSGPLQRTLGYTASPPSGWSPPSVPYCRAAAVCCLCRPAGPWRLSGLAARPHSVCWHLSSLAESAVKFSKIIIYQFVDTECVLITFTKYINTEDEWQYNSNPRHNLESLNWQTEESNMKRKASQNQIHTFCKINDKNGAQNVVIMTTFNAYTTSPCCWTAVGCCGCRN